MTGTELRNKVRDIMKSWIGAKEGSSTYKEILKIYNDYASKHGLAKAYEGYAWCDITASAAWIKAGMAEYAPISMSCGTTINLAKKLGIWNESDDFCPSVGCGIIYDWEDTSGTAKDNTTGHDHIGIVTAVASDKKSFTVVEGNKGNPSVVGSRKVPVNWKYIRGFIVPNYTSIAKKLTPQNSSSSSPTAIKIDKGAKTYTVKKGDTLSAIAKAAGTTVAKLAEINKMKDPNKISVGQVIKLVDEPDYKGTYTVVAKKGLNLRSYAGTKYTKLATMPYKAKFVCDGMYKVVDGTVWLHGSTTIYNKKYLGWCSKEFLE